MNNCARNNTVTIFRKQKIQKVQRDIDKNPCTKNARLEYIIHNASRIEQITTKETEYLNNTINKAEFMSIDQSSI